MTQKPKNASGKPEKAAELEFVTVTPLTSLERQVLIPAKGTENETFSMLPTGPAQNLLMEVFTMGEDIDRLPRRKKKVTHSELMTVSANEADNSVTVHQWRTNGKIDIVVDVPPMTPGTNKTIKKFFVFYLMKAAEQSLHDGELARNYVTFSLQELVNKGLYSNIRAARAGIESALNFLQSIKVKGVVRYTKNNKITSSKSKTLKSEVMFPGYEDIINNQCKVYLSERINWKFFTQYYTPLPSYYFKLSNRAADLLLYTLYLARQNAKKIAQNGQFNISLRAIQTRLYLPTEQATEHPKRDIEQPVFDAIAEIMKREAEMTGNTDEFSLSLTLEGKTITPDAKIPVSDFLDRGYLQIDITGKRAEAFIDINERTAKSVKAAKERQARIEEKAAALKLTKEQERACRSEIVSGND